MSGVGVRWAGLLWVLAALTLGCGGEFTDTPPEQPPEPEPGVGSVEVSLPIDFSSVSISWTPCSLHELPSASGEAECADVDVPLLWNEDPRTITVHLKRKLADTQPSPIQVWFLAGGPGSAATVAQAPLMDVFQQLGVDVYAIDHRGTGGSSLLDCPGVQAASSPGEGALVLEEIDDCVSYLKDTHGDALLGYAETYSAIDLRAMIFAEQGPGQRVFLTGGSGGTILAQRFLQLFSDAADGVILEAINPADRSIVDWADASDSAMRNLLDVCNSDPACGPRLDDDPYAAWLQMVGGLTAGACPAVTDRYSVEEVERLLSSQMLFLETQLWLIPAMIYRLRRCDTGDVTAFDQLAANVATLGANNSAPTTFSWTLLRHISFSEMVHNERFPSDEDIEAYMAEQRDFGAELARTALEGSAAWEAVAYEDPAFDNQWAQTLTPMLMLQGALDPLTPATGARRVGENFSSANQQYVEFPNVSHGFTGGSTLVQTVNDTYDCRLSMWFEFFASQGQPVDTSCVALTPAIDFDPEAATVWPLLGTQNAWD